MSATYYTHNEVYTKVRQDILSTHSTANVTSTYNPKPSKFPAVFVQRAGATELANYVTLANDDDQRRETWELQVFSNKRSTAQTEAFSIMETALTSFKSIGYILDMIEPMNNVDPSIYRLVARLHRTIGGCDTISQST